MSDDSTQPILAAAAWLEAGQTQLRAELMARMDRLQHTLDQVKGDIGANYGTADRTERIAQSASDEGRALALVVRIMQRQTARLETDVGPLRTPVIAGDIAPSARNSRGATRLRTALGRLHWSGRSLAAVLGEDERKVRRWAAGVYEPPEDVLAGLVARVTQSDG